MSSSLRIRKFQTRLQGAAATEATAASTITGMLDAELMAWDVKHLMEVEEAVILLPQAEQRERYGPLLVRASSTHAVGNCIARG
jgi:hypothetical protein